MKVLFLDVDGVLNDLEWIKTNAPKPSFQATIDDLTKHLDPNRVVMINDIVTRTGCKIVLSSSTRVDPRMSVVLARAGLKYPIYSSTPVLLWRTSNNGTEYEPTERAEEVVEWLKYNIGVDRYVILDDQDLGWSRTYYKARPLSKYWVQTSFDKDGLTKEHKEKIINLLINNSQ